jgi:nicotinamidase-related amidase
MINYDKFLSERDKLVFAKSGHGKRVGFGNRPVILVIDVNYGFCGETPEPILKSIETYHNSCGEEAWAGVAAIERLLTAAREKRLPVIYTTGFDQPIAGSFGLGRWNDKVPAEAADMNERANEIVSPIAPRAHDIVISKTMPSAFFATNLASYLVYLAADTILVCGTTTSGCVRASVVDGFSHNYRMIVVEEGTFDRGQASHAINLFDMDMKYADVEPLESVLTYIDSLEPSLFDREMPILAQQPVGEAAVVMTTS